MILERTISLGRLTINAARVGDGPPLVLLHGVVRCWRDFVPVLPGLALRWQVTAIDQRGHGRSGRTPGEYLVVDYVRDLVALLQSQFSEPAVVWGHSLGAMVALAAAAEAPDRVRAVVLEDPPLDEMGNRIAQTSYPAMFVRWRELAASGLGVREIQSELIRQPIGVPGREGSTPLGQLRDASLLRFIAACLRSLDPEVFDPIVAGRWLSGYDIRQLAPRVACPVLVLQGEPQAGGLLTDADCDLVRSLLADCTQVRMVGVGHMIHWLRPEAALRLVHGFLESLEK